MYVKMRDKGSVFYDQSQQVKISGSLPFKVKNTDKIARAINSKILVGVPDAEAKKILADASEEIEKVKKAQEKLKSPAPKKQLDEKLVKALETKLDKTLEALENQKAETEALKEKVAELETQKAETEALVDELAKVTDGEPKTDEAKETEAEKVKGNKPAPKPKEDDKEK